MSERAGMTLSPSVELLRRQFHETPVTAVALIDALVRAHRDYAPTHSRALPLADDRRYALPAEEWLARANDVFDAGPTTVLHGRLLIIALCLLDLDTGGQLLAIGVLPQIIGEIADAPPLREPYDRKWQILLGEVPYPAPSPAYSAAIGQDVEAPPRAESTLRSKASNAIPPAASPADAPVSLPSDERVATHADDPAVVDQLGRRPFATVLADRIREVWAMQDRSGGGSFMVHVHGPWGSGKSSVLNFLAADLRDRAGSAGEPVPIVVEFNAWRHQRLRPPWWSLMREIHEQAVRTLAGDSRLAALRLRLRWRVWRARLDWLPVAVALLLLVLGVPLAWLGARAIGTEPNAELPLKLLATLLTLGAAAFALSRSLVFGSARAAQTYAELRNDPLDPIIDLFSRLVAATGRPVVVFIDDLDRCEATYVVELLEGIQTLFRSAPVTYVIAADRKWICSSFETRYEDFGATIGEPGRPLGYLFLDKLFQISAPVPQPPATLQRTYWEALLRGGAPAGASLAAEARAREEAALRALHAVHTQGELERKIVEARDADGPSAELAMRAAAARRITSPEAQQAAEHRLRGFAPLLEPNPRAMKRLVNAFGLHQATHLLEGRSVRAEALARWTIVELRWPLLADYLAAHPRSAALLAHPAADGNDSDGAATGLPAHLQPLRADELVHRVLGGDGANDALDEEAIREIVGSSAGRQTSEIEKSAAV